MGLMAPSSSSYSWTTLNRLGTKRLSCSSPKHNDATLVKCFKLSGVARGHSRTPSRLPKEEGIPIGTTVGGEARSKAATIRGLNSPLDDGGTSECFRHAGH
jgi:hypothetical protein